MLTDLGRFIVATHALRSQSLICRREHLTLCSCATDPTAACDSTLWTCHGERYYPHVCAPDQGR